MISLVLKELDNPVKIELIQAQKASMRGSTCQGKKDFGEKREKEGDREGKGREEKRKKGRE
jgi:hypothetical protein